MGLVLDGWLDALALARFDRVSRAFYHAHSGTAGGAGACVKLRAWKALVHKRWAEAAPEEAASLQVLLSQL